MCTLANLNSVIKRSWNVSHSLSTLPFACEVDAGNIFIPKTSIILLNWVVGSVFPCNCSSIVNFCFLAGKKTENLSGYKHCGIP